MPGPTYTPIAKLESLPRDALLSLWGEVMDIPLPPQMSLRILRAILAFEIQLLTTRGAKALSRSIAKKAAKPRSPRQTIRPKKGATLLREWNGILHEVRVLERGFEWNGQTWRSLSAIAEAITGSRWSGPRFFGLTAGRLNT